MSFTRRALLQTTIALPLVSFPFMGVAAEPIKRAGTARLLTGLAAYSFREYFVGDLQRPVKMPKTERTMDMFGFIDYCADLGCAGAELTSYFLPKDLSGDVLQRIRRHAFLRGVAITGTAIANNFTLPKGEPRDAQLAEVKMWIDQAAKLGAPHIRVFAGTAPKEVSPDAARVLCIEALQECCDYAGRYGIFLGLENHGGIVAESDALLAIVKAVNSPWVGINLDSGNFHTVDPYGDLAKCAPYAVNVQIKAVMKPAGATESQPSDYARIITMLREANYQGFVTLEFEEKEDPYIGVPREFARMAALCNAK